MKIEWTVTEANKKEILNQLLYFFLDKNDLKNNIIFYKEDEKGKIILGDLQFRLELPQVTAVTPFGNVFKVSLLYSSGSIGKLIGFYTYQNFSGDLRKDLERVLPEIINEFFKYLGYVLTNNEDNYVKKEDYNYLEHFPVVNE